MICTTNHSDYQPDSVTQLRYPLDFFHWRSFQLLILYTKPKKIGTKKIRECISWYVSKFCLMYNTSIICCNLSWNFNSKLCINYILEPSNRLLYLQYVAHSLHFYSQNICCVLKKISSYLFFRNELKIWIKRNKNTILSGNFSIYLTDLCILRGNAITILINVWKTWKRINSKKKHLKRFLFQLCTFRGFYRT